MTEPSPVADLAAARRVRKARDRGACPHCGGPRAACSPYGRPCYTLDRPPVADRDDGDIPW